MPANATPGTNVYVSSAAPNKYGSSPKDSNREAINYANAMLTQDYTGRAAAAPNAANDLVSPLTLSATAGFATVIVIPPNAVSIQLSSTAAFNISEIGVGGAALTQYYTQPASAPVVIQLARQQYIYVSGGISQVISFFFQTL